MILAPQEERTFFATSVTWARRSIFRSPPHCELFLEILRDHRSAKHFEVHEFVLMRDHFHLLLTPAPLVSLERALQFIKGGFSFRVKRELRSNYEIWQKAFSEHRIRSLEDYDRHVDYIWNNPVKKGLAARPADFPYSSAKLRDNVDPPPPWLKAGAKARGV
jgi:REP-associated tyrosine transposase